MSTLTATSKGIATREVILERAYSMASQSGLEGLSIGPLAQAVGMSKSGVFAHFGSREELQLAVLDSAANRFGEMVLVASLPEPRGLPRLRAIMRNWFEWVRTTVGGCVLMAAASEYDDRPGPLRDRVRGNELRWRSALQHAVQLAIDKDDLLDGDAGQYVFELYAIALGVHHDAGLFGYDTAQQHGNAAVEYWFTAHSPSPPR
jgi:AcrR family transcriptional regulator